MQAVELGLAGAGGALAAVGALAATRLAVRRSRRQAVRAVRRATARHPDVHVAFLFAIALAAGPARRRSMLMRARMWQAVHLAGRSVRAAEQAAGPVGELPALAGRLWAAAESLDGQLRLAARGGMAPAGLVQQVQTVCGTARQLQEAALASCAAATAVVTGQLAADTELEIVALGSGRAWYRRATAGR